MEETAKIRVLVVDDSATIRGLWAKVIGAESDMTVTNTATNGITALEALKKGESDVVLLDLEMPEMDGITAIPLILKARPGIRIVIVSSQTTVGSKAAIQALTLGASDYITKPSAISASGGLAAISRELLAKIRALGTNLKSRAQETPEGATPAGIHGAGKKPKIVVIGSSTGGPNALDGVLKGIARGISVPVLIVQHMPPHFTSLLAESLKKSTGHPCFEATQGTVLNAGEIYLAPGDYHMTLVKGQTEKDGVRIRLDQNPPENFCRPAVDPLFRSAADVYGDEVLAVVLTGMGEDGKLGAEAVRSRGGMVLAQDESSSVVWGMPGAVVKAGLASAVLGLDRISGAIDSIVRDGGLGSGSGV